MIKYYKIFKRIIYRSVENGMFSQKEGFKNQFDTKEECVNFMLSKDNSYLFSEEEEYTVMEIFKKLPKNKENEPR